MPRPFVELEGLSIVLRGHFNPAIVTPGWLLAQKLLSVEDFTETRPDLITSDMSNFHGPWFTVNVTSDTLQVSTGDLAETEPIRDLIVGILRALPHTPVGVMGINHDFHFRVDNVAEWHAIGDTLAPKEPWGDAIKFPGMLGMQMIGVRDDAEGGRVRVTVEPSNRVAPRGVYVSYNDHFSLAPSVGQPNVREDVASEIRLEAERPAEPSADKTQLALQLLFSQWQVSRVNALKVLQQISGLTRTAQ